MTASGTKDSPPPSPQAQRGALADEIDLWGILAMLVEQRWVILGIALIVTVLGVTVAAVTRGVLTYTSTASFFPQESGGGGSRIAGLAEQFGIASPGVGSTGNPQLYAELVSSRRLLSEMLDRGYEVMAESSRQEINLVEYLTGGDPEELADRKEAIAQLRSFIQVGVQRETGIVTVTVSTPDPILAQQLAEGVLDRVHAFNIETRQSQAAAERRFVAERLEALRADLAEAEHELQRFLESNREFENSPGLRFRHEHLQRNVAVRHQVFTSLVQAFERAKIEEVRATPVITVLEEPDLPVRPDGNSFLFRALIILTMALLLGIGVGAIRSILQEGRTVRTPGYQRLQEALASAKTGLGAWRGAHRGP